MLIRFIFLAILGALLTPLSGAPMTFKELDFLIRQRDSSIVERCCVANSSTIRPSALADEKIEFLERHGCAGERREQRPRMARKMKRISMTAFPRAGVGRLAQRSPCDQSHTSVLNHSPAGLR